eukprot:CAMPEP_0175861176 /NCGR_PEP_ID=MMETSP0107_2-20121207/31229_1 /TAXON_ID=195067 ORGANISM="Goniomonas pacifica, Strain CCMP1869" /NCGR_SAMPLE_ID=MMETSP0107_2 /ASSEMBLY_ACC=CAM_ASM_000203 /LENGTH=82 /DNA_ID=CAMNT_0017178005 /DNA_START=395 /DNA_END=644 /DNA_ORIENTATION=-
MATATLQTKEEGSEKKLRDLQPLAFMEFTAELRQLEAMQGDLPDSSATDRAKKDFAELKKDFAKLKGDDVEIANAEKDLAKA